MTSSMTGSLGFLRALFETALNASELRSHLVLGANNFVIRTGAGTFDFQRAFTTGLGAEYRETRLLAEEFFRRYAERTNDTGMRGDEERAGDAAAASGFPVAQLPQAIGPLRNWYRHQERSRFEMLSVRMVITAASPLRGIDDVRHEIVFRPSESPIHCYKINALGTDAPCRPGRLRHARLERGERTAGRVVRLLSHPKMKKEEAMAKIRWEV